MDKKIDESITAMYKETKETNPTIERNLSDDDPERRSIETVFDQGGSIETISQQRLKSLEEALRMPVLYEESRPKEDYYYAQKAVSGKSNWLQVGPTAIPDGQTAAT